MGTIVGDGRARAVAGEAMTLGRRRLLGVIGMVLAGAAALDGAAWWIATARLRTAYARWQASLERQGWQIESRPPEATGWPLAARLRLDEVRLSQVGAGAPAWAAAHVAFGVSMLRPATLEILPGGMQTLTGPGLAPVQLQAATFVVRAPLGGAGRQAVVHASLLRIETPAGEARADAMALEASWTEAGAHLHLEAGPGTLPAGHRWGLGQAVQGVTLDLVGHGAWGAGVPREAAARWRDGGGTVDITAMELRWGTLYAAGSGRVTLDAGLQPAATLDLKITNPGAALSTLADTGAISRGAATAAGAVLSLLSLPARIAGQPDVLAVPVRLESGVVLLGEIPLARTAPLRW